MKRLVLNRYVVIFTCWVSFLQASCKKFVEIGPPKTGVVDVTVFTNITTVRSAFAGIYSDMQSNSSFASGGDGSITMYCGLSADEFTNFSSYSDQINIAQNSILPDNTAPSGSCWNNPYNYIYQCNAIIEGVGKSTTLSNEDKARSIGEAKFVRAFCLFYLTNLFGDIPLPLSTDYRVNNVATKSTQETVYNQIITDLLDAQASMQLPSIGTTRVLPNADAATALLSRVYLYTGKFDNAIKQSGSLINNSARYYLPGDLDSIFLMESPEAIWQLQPVIPGLNTNEGNLFILTSVPYSVALSNSMLAAFGPGDARKSHWTNSINVDGSTFYFPFKYKIQTGTPLTEYSMVSRMAEQYLIRAEAKTQMGDYPGAAQDINVIRQRAGLPKTPAADKTSLLKAIEQERRVELFAEWGHRWLDLKRTGRANAVLSVLKPSWKSTAALYPIPQAEISANKNITQNPGY